MLARRLGARIDADQMARRRPPKRQTALRAPFHLPQTGIDKAGAAPAGPMAPAALHSGIGMLSLKRHVAESGVENSNGHFRRLALSLLFALTFPLAASAETVAQTVQGMGIDRSWSLDCSLKPDRNRGTVLDYEMAGDGRVLHRRNFGDMTDESEVVTAEISKDGLLNLRVFFPSLKQTREYGLMMQADGTCAQYTIATRRTNTASRTASSSPTAALLRRSINAGSARARRSRAEASS